MSYCASSRVWRHHLKLSGPADDGQLGRAYRAFCIPKHQAWAIVAWLCWVCFTCSGTLPSETCNRALSRCAQSCNDHISSSANQG